MKFDEYRTALKLWNRGHWKNYLFSQGMLLLASLFLVFFISIGMGVQDLLDRFLSNDLPAEQVKVTPKGLQAGFFQSETGGMEITESIRLYLDSIPEVARIDPQIYLHVPAYLSGRLGGSPYYTDITLEGVTSGFLADSLLTLSDWEYSLSDTADKYLPIILSENLFLLYNAGFAESNNLLGLTPEAIVGLECSITLGRSSLVNLRHNPITVNARIIGTSKNMNLFALGAPFEFVEEVNQIFLPEDTRRYSTLVITAVRAEDVPKIVRDVEETGLNAETRRGIAQKAEVLVGSVTLALSALAGIILFSALLSAIHTLVADLRSRKYALGVLMALGTPQDRMAMIFAFQVFFLSSISVFSGAVLGCLMAWGASYALLSISPVLQSVIETIAVFPIRWILISICFILITATGSAYLFFRRILSTPVNRLLRG
ncbi:MAG: hypothetical protein H8D05_00475 [FCB group bacterium]|nr:hypothetical protein [FCB group bacterium]